MTVMETSAIADGDHDGCSIPPVCFVPVLVSLDTMLTELLPFPIVINKAAIAGTALWGLALYLGFSPLGDWVIYQINRWLNFAERTLYTSEEEYEKARNGWESQNAFLASLMSVIPFLVVGGLLNYGLTLGLGGSWAISLGMITCIGCGVYELGRRDSQTPD